MEENNVLKNLPIEIIAYIFKYLSIDDLKDASLVCRKWFDISQTQFTLNTKFRLHHTLDKYDILHHELIHKYTNLEFEYLTFTLLLIEDEKYKNIWIKFGETVTDINIDKCTINEEMLFKLLDNFPKLQCLSIFYSVQPSIIYCDNILYKYMDKLKSLSLINTFLLNDEIIEKIVAKETLTIEHLKIFIFNYSDKFPLIMKLIKKLSINLKSLTTYLWDVGLQKSLSEMENLKLETLIYDINEETDCSTFKKFTKRMNTLKKLEISNRVLVDRELIDICTFMLNLKDLQIINCNNLTNDSFMEIIRLKKLEKLRISKCPNISSEGIVKGIARLPNNCIQQLSIEGEFNDETINLIAKNLTNLQKLDLKTSKYLTEYSINNIFKHLHLLRELKLIQPTETQHQRSETTTDVCNNEKSYKNTISNCKGLKKLKLNGFKKLKSASMKHIGELRELESLKISNFINITKDEIEKFVKNCRSLKIIEFYVCETLNNDMVLLIGTHMRRLKRFTIVQEAKIDDEIIKKLKNNNELLEVKYYCRSNIK